MRIIREKESPRLRASLRALLPAVSTLAMLVVGVSVVGRFLEGRVLLQIVLVLLWVSAAAFGLWMATKLDHRTYEEYGLTLDAEWGLDFAIGVAITTLVVAASILWGVSRGIMEVNAGGTVTDGGALSGTIAVIIVFVGFFLTQNVYEELVYRGIVMQNFMEGLVSRGISPAVAVVPVTVVSTSLFGLFHLPLRGSVLAVVDAAVVGIAFSLAYLLTGSLGLGIGVHFGRLSIELLFRNGFGIVEMSQQTLSTGAEITFLRLGLTCLLIVAWVYVADGSLRIAGAVYRDSPMESTLEEARNG